MWIYRTNGRLHYKSIASIIVAGIPFVFWCGFDGEVWVGPSWTWYSTPLDMIYGFWYHRTISLSAYIMTGKIKAIVFLIIVVLLIGGAVGIYTWKKGTWKGKNTVQAVWSVVYLSSGEIYVGKLQWSKRPQFDQGYLVMKVANEKDPKSSDIRLQPLSETVWAPTTLYLNPEHILFSGPLDPNSTAAKRLKEKGVL